MIWATMQLQSYSVNRKLKPEFSEAEGAPEEAMVWIEGESAVQQKEAK